MQGFVSLNQLRSMSDVNNEKADPHDEGNITYVHTSDGVIIPQSQYQQLDVASLNTTPSEYEKVPSQSGDITRHVVAHTWYRLPDV